MDPIMMVGVAPLTVVLVDGLPPVTVGLFLALFAVSPLIPVIKLGRISDPLLAPMISPPMVAALFMPLPKITTSHVSRHYLIGRHGLCCKCSSRLNSGTGPAG